MMNVGDIVIRVERYHEYTVGLFGTVRFPCKVNSFINGFHHARHNISTLYS